MPCLVIGVISAVFQIPGNVEDKREALMIDVTKGIIIGRQSVKVLMPGVVPVASRVRVAELEQGTVKLLIPEVLPVALRGLVTELV